MKKPKKKKKTLQRVTSEQEKDQGWKMYSTYIEVLHMSAHFTNLARSQCQVGSKFGLHAETMNWLLQYIYIHLLYQCNNFKIQLKFTFSI